MQKAFSVWSGTQKCLPRLFARMPGIGQIAADMENEEKLCIQCGKPVYGRPDKLFCSNKCRNDYHNRINAGARLRKDRVISILWNNYKLLEMVLNSGNTGIDLRALQDLGFQVSYITGHRRARGGRDEYSCFDILYNKTEVRLYNIRRTSAIV